LSIGDNTISVNCPAPGCSRVIQVTLSQVAKGATVKCSCGQSVKLEDGGGQTKRAIRSIDGEIDKLGKTLRRRDPK